MERLACVNLPEFPLQLLLAKHPEWRRFPAAVVAHDKPQGEILWVSPEARAAGVLPGMRYAQGLSLAAGLRAAEVSMEEVQTEVEELANLLRRFSPDVEISEEEPGIFWVNAAGLLSLFPSLDVWARRIHAALTAAERRASVVVGFQHFSVYAIAKGSEGVLVPATVNEEKATLRCVPLKALAIDPHFRDTLAKLGIHTLGEFLHLPPSAMGCRFGNEAVRLHALACGEAHDPLVPVPPVEPVTIVITLETAEGNSIRLLFAIQEHLHGLLAKLAERGEALQELEVCFSLEQWEERADRTFPEGERTDRIRPAEATLDEALIIDLLRLRLEGIPLRTSAKEIGLTAHGIPGNRQQIKLFMKAPRRDLGAANRALARIRAELGEQSVVRARLAEGHLPESRFAWESFSRLPKAQPNPEGKPTLIRRLYSQPSFLGIAPNHGSNSHLIRGLHNGQIVHSWGPYILSGEWWQSPNRQDIRRHYYFLETEGGKILWAYYDSLKQQWFLQGQVE
jgi:protein ImuB